MENWKYSLIMALIGIGPVTVVIVLLQQIDIIGLATALLLGFLYLLFVSSHIWCRLFTKRIPSTSQEQDDVLPCYEEAVAVDPPSYYSIYPESSSSCNFKVPMEDAPSIGSKDSAVNGHTHLSISPATESTTANLPITRLSEKDQKQKQMTFANPENVQHSLSSREVPGISAACCGNGSDILPRAEAKRTKKQKFLSAIMKNIVNPIDVV